MAAKRVNLESETVVAPSKRSTSRWSRLPGIARGAVLVGAGLAAGLFVGHRGGLLPRGGDLGDLGRGRMGGQMVGQMDEMRDDFGAGGPGGFGMMGGFGGGPRGGRDAGFDGTITAASGSSITIAAANGTSVTVTLPAAATVLTKSAGTVQDLVSGATVHVDLLPGTTDQVARVVVTK